MENQELYQTNENGQLVVNWDSLELLTNSSFVADIKDELKLGGQVFHVYVSKLYINVYVASFTGNGFLIYRFCRMTNEEVFDCVMQSEIAIINKYRKSVKR